MLQHGGGTDDVIIRSWKSMGNFQSVTKLNVRCTGKKLGRVI